MTQPASEATGPGSGTARRITVEPNPQMTKAITAQRYPTGHLLSRIARRDRSRNQWRGKDAKEKEKTALSRLFHSLGFYSGHSAYTTASTTGGWLFTGSARGALPSDLPMAARIAFSASMIGVVGKQTRAILRVPSGLRPESSPSASACFSVETSAQMPATLPGSVGDSCSYSRPTISASG